MKSKYKWDDVRKIATYSIYYNNKVFTGYAFSHPNDEDLANEKTGLTIAEMRAEIKLYKHIRDCEVIPAYKCLKHLNHIIGQGEHNKKNRETRLLYREMIRLEKEIIVYTEEIKKINAKIKSYIEEKE